MEARGRAEAEREALGQADSSLEERALPAPGREETTVPRLLPGRASAGEGRAGRKLGWGSSEQGSGASLRIICVGPEQEEVPLPCSLPPSALCESLGLASVPALGPSSLLTLLLFKVDLRVLLLLFINFYAARSPCASPICPV